ncbi:efflux RND transporter periplasmic adaptor subunit [Algiphilus aromaticivorans]|uniref:efflux RND transporter periplasmic adaptor subunit n=1 Tax=Algiphilus aromaticivorans TaxID=382454 RepID=UPI0006936ADA|nr:efflux RND transporter periplasmic adaptor subunit [Algiphilus aromaticivorans]
MRTRNYAAPLLLAGALMATAACGGSADGTGAALAGDDAAARPQHTIPAERDEQESGGHEAGATRTSHPQASGHGEAGHEEGGETGHERHAQEERVLHLEPAQREQLSLRIAPAEAGTATDSVQAPATLAFDADRMARVGPRLEAKVLDVSRDLGESVAAGDRVANLDSVALGRAKAAYLTARAKLSAERANHQRHEKLAEQQIISQEKLLSSRATYLQAQAERDAARAELRLYGMSEDAIGRIAAGGDTPLSRYPLTAPIGGIIQQRDLVPGQTLSAQDTPIHIVNTERMWVLIEADAQDLPRLAPGQPVSLSLRALPGKRFEGTTNWVSRELDEAARTVRVRAEVANPNGALRAGMFGTARIVTDDSARYALVPVDAVQTIDGEQVIFVPGDETGVFRAVPVVTGAEGNGRIEIREGLSPGDRVVTDGAFDLKSALTASGRSAAHSH